jgi:hypothetical protein
MNTRILLLAALLPLGAVAAPPTGPAPSSGVIEFNCVQPTLPPLRAVADLYGMDNWDHVYDRRMRLMHDGRHACKQRGADSLLIVAAPGVDATTGERRVAMLVRR